MQCIAVFAEEFNAFSGPPGSTIVCATRGPEGVVVHGGPHAGEHTVPPAHVVDATGAGDAFCGGFLAVALEYPDGEPVLIFRHRAADGSVNNEDLRRAG